MGEVDKPFSCSQPGCGMSFTNEDHLTVHRRRHEMMHLTVPGDHHTSSLVKHSGFIIDQTPTPTRFLRQCEEVGLFQDLNPFDEQFRRASLRSTHSINESLEVGTGGSLDTPRILPLADSDETISSTSRDDINLSVAPGAGNISTSHYSSTSHRHTTRPQTSIRISSPGCETDVEGGERLRLNVSSAAEAAANTTSVISTPTPVITAGPSVTHSLDVQLGGDKLSGSYQIPLHPSQSNALCASPSNVPPSPSATVLQLLLRLPNGQAIPVEIPATPVATNSNNGSNGSGVTTSNAPTPTATTTIATNPTGAPSTMLASGDHQVPQQPSLAKMKLKAALASSNTAARPGASRNSRANTADRIAEMTMNKSRDINGPYGTFSSDEEDNDESCDSFSASSHSNGTISAAMGGGGQKTERRRRHSSADDDPAEKRRKFLERNRAAAIRCREKKKKWIETLACKSDELGYINQKLQNEVSSLRSEVAALKSMLLQHKDCPVTLAMQGGEYKNEADSVAQLHSVVNPVTCQANICSNSSSSPGLGHKTRTRSLSMPSIPSSASTPVAPLTLNPITYANTTHSNYAISNVSSSSTVSSTTKVVSISNNITPMNLSNSMSSTHQPILHSAAITHATPVSIMKMSPARVASPKSSSAQHMMAAAQGMTQLGEVTILGSGELMSSDGQPRIIQDGTSNIIVATRSPSIHQMSQQQHSNTTNIILPAHSPASVQTQNANIMLATHSSNNSIQLPAIKETHVPQLLNLSINNNNKHPSAILRKKH